MPAHRRVPRRHALLVGIDSYPKLGAESRLFGAVRDALCLSEVLVERHGFAAGDIVHRLDADATRQGILDSMAALRDRASSGDTALFFFSGHGSQMTDREGDEGDGLDETLVPFDSTRAPGENRDISDDEIHLWSADMLERTSNLVLIFDCCHSATLHRPLWPVRSVPADLRPAGELPASPVDTQREIDPGLAPAVVLSACLDNQLAHEVPPSVSGVARGAFSWHLVQALAEAEPSTTWRAVAERVRAGMASLPVEQKPMAAGEALDAPLFAATRAVRGNPSRRSSTRARVRSASEATAPGERRVVEAGAGWVALEPRVPAGWKLRLYRSRGGPWVEVGDDPGEAWFREGDRLRIDLCHGHRRRLFVYVLDFGIAGRLTQVFPELDGHEALDPGPTLTVGDRRGGELELYWPRSLPREDASAEGAESKRTSRGKAARGEGRLVVVACESRLRPSQLLAESDFAREGPWMETAFVAHRPYWLER